jgi:hypothetical protein
MLEGKLKALMAQMIQLLQPLASLQKSVSDNSQAISDLQSKLGDLQATSLTIEQVQEVASKTFVQRNLEARAWGQEIHGEREQESENSTPAPGPAATGTPIYSKIQDLPKFTYDPTRSGVSNSSLSSSKSMRCATSTVTIRITPATKR